MQHENQYHRHAINPPRTTLKDRLIEAYIRWDDYSPEQSEKVAKIVGLLREVKKFRSGTFLRRSEQLLCYLCKKIK